MGIKKEDLIMVVQQYLIAEPEGLNDVLMAAMSAVEVGYKGKCERNALVETGLIMLYPSGMNKLSAEQKRTVKRALSACVFFPCHKKGGK